LVIAQHLRLLRALLACLVVALAVTLLPAPRKADASARHDRVERSVVRKFNKIRAAHGLPRLRSSRALARSADYHSWDMLRANFFAHPSSNGDSMAKRVTSFRRAKRVGEVLAWIPTTSGRGQAARVVRMWMASAPHRASLLTGTFTRVGVGRRTGALGGQTATVFTADFSSAR
jgi:uncharacterized protein YkwD